MNVINMIIIIVIILRSKNSTYYLQTSLERQQQYTITIVYKYTKVLSS